MGEIRNPYINPKSTIKYVFSPTEEIRKLKPTQKVNQKIVLSYYGFKIDMPFKLFSSIRNIRMTSNIAVVKSGAHEAIEAHRIVIEHPLGITYSRLDVPKKFTASQLTTDAFSLAELNMRSKREFEDYLIRRRQFDLDFSAMDVGHRQARLERKYEYVNKGLDLVVGLATAVYPTFRATNTIGNLIRSSREAATEQWRANVREAGKNINIMPRIFWRKTDSPDVETIGKVKRARFASSTWNTANQETSLALALGAYKGYSGIASGITGLISASERASLQEEGFGIEISKKALESYTIDLGFERQKQEQLFTMRRIFANENFNDVADRQRQEILDEFESPAVKDVYLELWTTSGEQDIYVSDFHDKFGVDCRVANKVINFRDEIPTGIYCLEDVVIENLTDRVDFEFLRSRLTGGIKFIKWEESEYVKQLTIIDKRIMELTSQLSQCKRESLDYKTQTEQRIDTLTKEKDSLSNQLNEKTNQYHTLSESYRKKEAELQEQINLTTLYRNEAEHCHQDLVSKDQEHSQEKESHSGTKQQLEEEKGAKQSLINKLKIYRPITKLDATNLIAGCNPNYTRMVVCQYNDEKKAWIKTTNWIYANTTNKTVKIVPSGWKPTNGFDLKVTNYTLYQQVKDYTPVEGMTADSFQIENGIPFFENASLEDRTPISCRRWYKEETGWSHNTIQGGTQITNYGQYLDVLGLKLKGGRVVSKVEALQSELRETEQTLTGVREIERKLRAEKEVSNIWKKTAFKQVANNQEFAVVKKDETNFAVCEFNTETFAWVITTKFVMKYNSGRKEMKPFWKTPDFQDLANKNTDFLISNQGHTFTEVRTLNDFTSYFHTTNVRDRASWATNEKIVDKTKEAFPFFAVKPNSLQDRLIPTIYHSENEGWSMTEGDGKTKVETYEKYLEVLGMEAVMANGTITGVTTKKGAEAIA